MVERSHVKRFIDQGYSVVYTEHARFVIERRVIDPSFVQKSLGDQDPLLEHRQEQKRTDRGVVVEEKWGGYYPYSKKYSLRIVFVIAFLTRTVRIITAHKINTRRQAKMVGE